MFPVPDEPIVRIKNIKGWFQRGSMDDCPTDHLTRCDNCAWNGVDLTSRDGLTLKLFTDHVVTKAFPYSASVKAVTVTGFTLNILYLDNAGNLYDASTFPATLVHAFGGGVVDDLAFLEAFGRVYLAPKKNTFGVVGEFTYYWDGTNFRKVAGVAPVGAVTLAQANPGIVDAGDHIVYTSFLYATGYLSPPSPGATITSTGVNDIEVSNIPIGGAGVVGRVILMTLAAQTEPFFVPGGTINDNVTTTFIINVHDSALLESADYLNDVLPTVPSCAAIRFYKARLVLIGRSDFPFIVMLSDVGIYDSFNNINNIINTPKDNLLNSPKTGAVILNILYIFKQYGTYSIQDNGDNPSTWDVTLVDAGLGTNDDSGISVFSSGLSGMDVLDSSFVVSPRGLLLFNGNYADPPLSFKINDYWQNLGIGLATHLKICNDINKKRVYFISNLTSTILMGDYSEGLTPAAIKWSLWSFTNFAFTPTDLVLMFDNSNNYFPFLVGTSVNSYTFTPGQNFDATLSTSTSLGQYIQTAPIFLKEGTSTCFNGFRLRIKGTGAVSFQLTDENNAGLINPPGFNLSSYTAAQDLFRMTNYQNEKMMVGILGTAASNGIFTLIRLDIFGTNLWGARPALTQST